RLPAQGPLELRLAAPVAPLPGRALPGGGRALLQAQGAGLAAPYRDRRPVRASPAGRRGGVLGADRLGPPRLRRLPLLGPGLLRPPRPRGGGACRPGDRE